MQGTILWKARVEKRLEQPRCEELTFAELADGEGSAGVFLNRLPCTAKGRGLEGCYATVVLGRNQVCAA